MTSPFKSTHVFREAFNKGLYELAEQVELGPFILACANATTHSDLFDSMKSALEQCYQEIYENCRHDFMAGRDLDVVDEDLLVFLKLHAIGFEAVKPSEIRYEGIWQLQFNHLRSFRPRRITQYVHEGIYTPYDEDDFNFNKPFMAKECFWKGKLMDRHVDLFYNKYPFADLHGLLVVDSIACKPQFLEQAEHEYIVELTKFLDQTITGTGFGYNSYGAYASVNHLHFQMFVDVDGLPVTSKIWKHNGGSKEYPAECHAFETAEDSWEFLENLHQLEQPYNILYYGGIVYLFPRKTQGTAVVPEWSSGFTWYELSGGMIMFNYDEYTHLHDGVIERYLNDLRVDELTS